MNDRAGRAVDNPLPAEAPAVGRVAQPPAGYAGQTRFAQLEYEAVLANASIGIAFTRERKFFLCNPKFEEMFGWPPGEIIGQPGEVVYPSRESYEALGQIASPILSAGRQLDLEWEVRRKDGSTFLSHMIAKAINPAKPQQGTVWIVEDITGRKRHADELGRVLREQEAILETASIGIAFLRERVVVRSNRHFEAMYGYEPGELIGQSTSLLYASEEDFRRGSEAYERMAKGLPYEQVAPRRRKDGSVLWVRATGRAIDPRDPLLGTVWIHEDITEQRRAEEELQRLLAEQQALLNNVVVGIAFIRNRQVIRCNRRFEELFGYAAGEGLGLAARQLYFTDDEDDTERARAYEELDQGHTHQREQWLRRKDGSGFPCRLSGRALQPGDPDKGYIWLFEDVTERKRADEAMQRMVREQNALLDSAMIGIAFLKERRVMRCNQRFEELFGYAQGELLNQSMRRLHASEEDYAAGEQAYERLWRGETHQRERRMVRKDGSLFWCLLSGRAVQASDPQQGSVWLFDDITERKRADEEVRRLASEQQQILDNATVGIMFVRERVIQRCNRRLEEMTGHAAGGLQGRGTEVLFAEADEWRSATAAAYGATVPGETLRTEHLFRRTDGSTFVARGIGRRVDPGAAEKEWIWIIEDITEQRAAEEAIRRALAEQELILANATVGIAFLRNRTYRRCNPRFEEMFGLGPGEMLGRTAAFLFPGRRAYAETSRAALSELAAGRGYTAELQLRRKDGSPFWCKVVGKAIDPAHLGEGSIWIYDDISAEHAARESLEASRAALERAVAERTAELESANRRLEQEIGERKQAEERAQHLADHDVLTGLPNRRLLEDRLTQALALSYRNRRQTAVMFVDLDRFKTINDSLGHATGDALLKEVARRLVHELRGVDTICRLGGDEFVIVLPEIKRAADAAHVAQKLAESVERPIALDGRELHVTPSIGIAVFPDDGRDAATLIRNADAAMYHAKEMGRANHQFFTDQMNLAASRRLTLENDLRRALQKGELSVHYQPIIELKAGCTVAHEALLRWQHPDRGLVLPSEFVQLAEDTGLILGIGEWVLREACRWATFIGAERGLTVSVNLSARQFHDPKLAKLVAQALEESGLPPRLLELEITESTLMQHTEVTLATLGKLKRLGISLSVDDFGTGYSSLAYLKRFPVDKLKIDRSFVADLPGDKDAQAIIAAIVGLARALGLQVVAEGVETESQMEFLQRCGCDFIQGFLAGRPLDADTAAKEYI
jgi:diguanylate cyclase (GGDEF)-like protein/PAS domain S-box-containing protein